MSRLQLKQVFRRNEALSLSFSRILLVVMMTCFGLSLIQIGEAFNPSWNGSFLSGICLLISIEAVLVQGRIPKASDREHSIWYYRTMEWVVILITIKIILYFRLGWGQFLADLPNWSRNFLSSFFTGDYFAAVFITASVWGFTLWFLSDLEQIEDDVNLVDASDLGGYYSNRSVIRKSLSNRFLIIGFAIVFMTALFTIDFGALIRGSFILHHRSGAMNIIIYFLAGMLLLSQTHFSVLRAGWAWERIPIEPQMAKRWITYSLVALVLVTALAFILPTSYSLGLLATLGYIFSLIFSLLSGLLLLIFAPLLMLLGWIYRLLGKNSPAASLPPVKLPEPPPEAVRTANPWMDFLQSVLFWAIFIGVVAYAFYQYFKQNKELVSKLKKLRGLRWLAQAWDWIKGRASGFNHAVAAVVGAGVQRLRAFIGRSAGQEAWNYLNLRRLTPRQQILFFFLAFLRRGGEAGLARKPAQTPYEYARFIHHSLPEVSDEVDSMTESFVEARYSLHPVAREQANQAKSYWERIRQALHTLKERYKSR